MGVIAPIRLLTNLSAPWRLLTASHLAEPTFNVALDEAIGESVGRGEAPPTVRLWQNGESLVLGRFELRDRSLGPLCDWANQQKVALLRRISGGTVVWHGPGALNFSICIPHDERLGIHRAYEALSAGIIRALKRWGLAAAFGSVPGSFCDGSHNIVIDGHKIAGTAQTRRKGFTLVHGTIFIDLDLEHVTRLIAGFYQQAGIYRVLKREALTTLAEALGRPISLDEAREAFVQGHAEAFGLFDEWQTSELMTHEQVRTRELEPHYHCG
jgi:lipoate-protein ligase A